MLKIVSLFAAAHLGAAAAWNLGFDKYFDADSDKLVKETIKITQADIDATTSTNPKLRLRGSRSWAASYLVYVNKDSEAKTSDQKGEVEDGSGSGYSDMTYQMTGPGTYHISVKSNCPPTGCFGMSTTLAAYLIVGSDKTAGLTNQTSIATNTIAPYRVTASRNGWSALYRSTDDENTVLHPAAYVILTEPTKIYIKAEVDSDYGGEFKILATEGGPAKDKGDSAYSIPSASGVGGDWDDSKELPAGHWYLQPMIYETATVSVATYMDIQFAVGIGKEAGGAAGLGPGLALSLLVAAFSSLFL